MKVTVITNKIALSSKWIKLRGLFLTLILSELVTSVSCLSIKMITNHWYIFLLSGNRQFTACTSKLTLGLNNLTNQELLFKIKANFNGHQS